MPEYYLTRTERSILEDYAGDILQAAGPSLTLVELGAGTATKTGDPDRRAFAAAEPDAVLPHRRFAFRLGEAMRHLGKSFPRLRVNPIVADYTGGVRPEPDYRPQTGAVYRIEHRQLRAAARDPDVASYPPTLRAGDALLLGADFAKSFKILVPAYDDAQGVTAAFNKNLLTRLIANSMPISTSTLSAMLPLE